MGRRITKPEFVAFSYQDCLVKAGVSCVADPSNEPEAMLFGNQLGTSPDAAKWRVTLSKDSSTLSKDDQDKESEPENRKTGKRR